MNELNKKKITKGFHSTTIQYFVVITILQIEKKNWVNFVGI